jgi:MYXO-CTERM domain-containing protein
MTKTAIALLVAAAGVASADVVIDRSGYEIHTAQGVAIGDTAQARGFSSLYNNQDGPYSAFPPAGAVDNPIGVADYQSIATNNIDVGEFVFVGGVDTMDTVVFFDFFDAGGTFLDGFGVALPEAGNFIWTITPTDLEIAADGLVQMTVDDGTNGPAGLATWFLNENTASVGNAGAIDVSAGLSSFNFAFSINGTEVPAPGAVALLGLGGLVASRRRR